MTSSSIVEEIVNRVIVFVMEETQTESPESRVGSEAGSSKDLSVKTSQIPLIGHQPSVNPSGNTFVINFDQTTFNKEQDEELEFPDDDLKYVVRAISLSKTYGTGPFSKSVLKCVNLNVLPSRM